MAQTQMPTVAGGLGHGILKGTHGAAMSRLVSTLALVLTAFGLTGCVFFASLPDTSLKTRAEAEAIVQPLDEAGVARWREAGRRIAHVLAKKHPNPWFRLSEAEFRLQVEGLDRDLPRLSERQAILRWMLIFAALGDEHTCLWEQSTSTQLWPIHIRVAPSGVFISHADQRFKDLRGARIVNVGGQPVEAYLESLEAFQSAPVPSHRAHRAAQSFPYGWIYLKDTGRLPSGVRPELDVEHADGRREIREMPTLDREGVSWTSLHPPIPLLRNADPSRFYTHRLIEEGRTLYIRYRSCRNQAGQESVWAFTGRVQQEAKAAPVERAVVDLRGNGGGNGLLFWRMERWLSKHPAFSRPGGLLVLTDSETFSSAFMAARNLQRAGGRVIGAEPGQPVNHYGQIHFTEIPGLRPAFACATKAFLFDPGDPTAWNRSLKVDLPLDETRADVLGMADSVLAAALGTPFPSK